MDIQAWLQGLGLAQYEAIFRENEIEADVLPDLTEADLEKIGLPLGPRKRILKAIAGLGALAPATAPANPPTPPADAAERRQLTVMFCDLVGSTALSAQLDPEDMRRVIRAYQDAVSGVVVRYDGFVAKFMGDGVLAYFGFPRAHEDDAARAVHAGLEIARVVGTLETPMRETLAARIGIATGLVVVGDIVGEGAAQEQAVVGDTPNLAARMQGLADAGGVVISAATRRLVGNGFRLNDLGRHAVKGLAEPVAAWVALGVAETDSRFDAAHIAHLTDFVGRAAEAADLRARQLQAWGGRGQIVLIGGEAGIGKSRMAAWIAQQAGDTSHVRLRYQYSPFHRDSALYPFAQQIERAAGFSTHDEPETKLDKLEVVLAPATDRLHEVAPLMAALLSIPTGTRYPPQTLSPAQQRRQTLFALLDQMEGMAKKQPILMLFEDAHWADPTSLEVIDLAIERLRKLAVLLLITFRPEFEPPWRGLPDVAEISLGRLKRTEAEALVCQVTGGRELPAEVMAQIVAKTDGVPLFVEELTKTVLESGLLIEEGQRYRLDGPLPPLAIPSTLQDSLMARLDRLATVKEVAQIGAAIGREFSYPLLHAVIGLDDATLRASLAQLEDSKLVFRAGEPPSARYTFKHALVQDTAYESLLKSRRQILHQRIAEALRDQFPAIVEAEPELVAEHFTRAGLIEAAIVHWGKAGDQALRKSAFQEAVSHLGRAIQMADTATARDASASVKPPLSANRAKLQANLGQALIWTKGYQAQETTAAFAKAVELANQTEGVTDRCAGYFGVWVGALTRGEPEGVREMAERFSHEIAANPRSDEAMVGHRILGNTNFFAGDFAAAVQQLRQALQLYDPARHGEFADPSGQDPGPTARILLALSLWVNGEIDEALSNADLALAEAQSRGHAATTVFVLNYKCVLSLLRNAHDTAAADCQSMANLIAQNELPTIWSARAFFFRGWIIWRVGDREAAVAKMGEGIKMLRDRRNVQLMSFFEPRLAEAEGGDVGLARMTTHWWKWKEPVIVPT